VIFGHDIVNEVEATVHCIQDNLNAVKLSYPVFIPKPSTHRMHDSGANVLHIRPKVFIGIQMSRIKYNYYINNVSKDSDNSQQNKIAEDSITPQERQPGQPVD
jgi:hypothetical protein